MTTLKIRKNPISGTAYKAFEDYNEYFQTSWESGVPTTSFSNVKKFAEENGLKRIEVYSMTSTTPKICYNLLDSGRWSKDDNS